MQNVNTRLNSHDDRIKDLETDLSDLSERLNELGKQVEHLQELVGLGQTAAKEAFVPETLSGRAISATCAGPAAGMAVVELGPAMRSEEWQETTEPTVPDTVEQVAASQSEPGPVKTAAMQSAESQPVLPAALATRDALTETVAATTVAPDDDTSAEPRTTADASLATGPGNAKLLSSSGAVSLEQRLSTNWLVWVGGVALALAGVFLVRYIAEQGWLSPATRCAIGVIFGVSLIVSGEVVRRRPLERAIAAIRADYVPQALTSAGFVAAFGSVYLAYAFYDLIPPGWSFVLLGVIALAAFLLSTVQGSFVAMLGLVGAALTPALVSTADPSPWGFFSYLGIIVLATMAVADRRHWFWLPELALAVIAGWSALWIAKGLAAEHIAPIGSTYGVVALAGLVLAHRAKTNAKVADLVAWLGLGLAAATAFAMALKSGYVLQSHGLILSYTVASTAIARFVPRFASCLPAMAALSVVTLGLSYVDQTAIHNILERALGWPAPTLYSVEKYGQFVTHAALIAVVAFVGGALALSRATSKMMVAVASAATPLLLVLIGYVQFRSQSGDMVWTLAACAVLIAATLETAVLRRSRPQWTDLHSVYAAAAVIAAFLALTVQFDRIWLTLAYAALVTSVALVSVRVDLPILRRLVNLIVLVVLLRLTVNPDLRGYEIFHPLGNQWVTYGYLVPLALFVAAARLFRRAKDDITVTVLEGAALLLGIMFVSIEIRIFMTGQIYSGEYHLPEMSLQTISWLTSAWVLARRNLRYPRIFSTWGSRLLTAAGSAQALVLQLVLFNPVFTGDLIQGYGLFNVLMLSLLAPAILLWMMAGSLRARNGHAGPTGGSVNAALYGLSVLLGFAFVTEEVRVLFQGMVITTLHATPVELYVTTLAWILPASIPYLLIKSTRSSAMLMSAMAVLMVSALAAVAGHGAMFNPVATGDAVIGIPILNSLLVGFIVPAALFYRIGTSPQMTAETPARILVSTSYALLFIGSWLIMKQIFQGETLVPLHQSLLELYVTTLVWLLMGASLLALPRARDLSGAENAAYAIVAISVAMLFIGHAFRFNPALDGSFVRGWPVFNELLLGFVVPAALLVPISRRTRPDLRTPLQIAAYLLLFVGVTMLVKHAFQGGVMVVETLSNQEDYAYSAAWLVLAIATLIGGIVYRRPYARYASLAVLIVVVVKVFVFDMSGLTGLWRVASLFGLGICLIGIGWIYQRFVFAPAPDSDMGPEGQYAVREK